MSAQPDEPRKLGAPVIRGASPPAHAAVEAADSGEALAGGSAASPEPADRRPGGPWLTAGRLLSLITVLVAAWGVLVVVRALRSVLLMLALALFLSFAMEPAVQFLGRRGWRRGPATGAVFLAVTLGLAGAIAAVAPLVIQQVNDLIRSIPTILDRLNERISQLPVGFDVEASPELRAEVFRLTNDMGERLREVALGAAGNVVDIGATALTVLLQLAAVALITFYLVADGPRFRRALARPLPPERQREMLAIWELAVSKTGGYIYSRLLLAIVAATATGLFLVIMAVPYPVPLALWVGVTTAFLPVIGTYVGGILPVLVALVSREPLSALWVLAFIVVYQQIENHLIAPRIHGRTMEIHPAIAFTSVIIGGVLLGVIGALLALPAAAIIQALLSTYVRRHELIDELADVPLPGEPEPPDSEMAPSHEPLPSDPAAGSEASP